MYTIILVIHVGVALALIALILVQRGRSSGLIEAMGGVESIFGTKTSAFFVRATVTLSVLFFLTSMSLAYLSKRRSASLLETVTSGQALTQETQSESVDAPVEESRDTLPIHAPQVPK